MLARITGRSPKEFLFRGRQWAWNAYDRLRLKAGHHPNVSGASASRGCFFVGADEYEMIRERYLQNPVPRRALLDRAEKICAHRYDLLGFSDLSFQGKGEIDWHYDPVHEVRLSRQWWQKMLSPGAIGDADPKVVWELNRHQHLVTLGQAFVITGEERYRAEIISQLSGWMDANPPKSGINWSSSLELSYRCIAWLWTWFLCGGEQTFGSLTDRFFEFISLQAEHVERNLSVYYSPNTHLTGEALGLFYVGTLLPGLGGAKRWREIGQLWLMQCLGDHVLSDGGYMERASWYHRYTADIYLHFYLLSLKNGDPPPDTFVEQLQALGEFMRFSLRPDRKLPHFGDDDGGRLLGLDGLPGDDPQGVLLVFDRLFRGEENEQFSEEALWLLGPAGPVSRRRDLERKPEPLSRVFSQTGYAFLRTGWSDDAVFVFVDCGPHGWMNGGHAHADMLGIEIYAGRNAIICDPGTFSYQAPWRNWFRGPESHAVVMCDGKHPAVPEGLFHWAHSPQLESVGHCFEEKIDYVRGTMDAGSWRHTREIFFLKPHLIVVLDSVAGEGCHEIEARFPLADRQWRITEGGCTSTSPIRRCTIQFDAGCQHGVRLLDGWHSDRYGRRQEANIVSFTLLTETPATFATLIDLSGKDRRMRKRSEGGKVLFAIETRSGSRTIATVQSSVKGEAVCAAFVA